MAQPKMEALTRVGFAARGVMYFVIGYLALRTGRTEDGSGAMEFLQQNVGEILLWIMALGFAAYGFWRLSEAVADTEGQGSDAKGIAVRAGGAASGLIHFALAFVGAKLALGKPASSGSAQDGAAMALDLPGGHALTMVAAAALAAVGVYQLVKAYQAGFLRTLDAGARGKAWIAWLGRAGYAARGVVFLVVGWLLWSAARDSAASKAGGIGEALDAFPPTARLIVAGGLLLFGLFSLVEARYRRINGPAMR